ncbi:MAG: bifunctional oligoribonuclease/PAP phosphatase NrnA [Proteocatella sp.]
MKKIQNIIENEKHFIVTSHTSPDGDNVGSSIGMTLYLRANLKKAYHIIDDSVPDNLRFLMDEPGKRVQDENDMCRRAHKIYTSTKFMNSEKHRELIENGNYVLIILDTADISRVCISEEILKNAKEIINIDHHVSNTRYGDINFVDPHISSTCELVCKILRKLDAKKITPQIATALYAGISTDTGNFLFNSVDAHTFENASFLTKMGADRDIVANRIYQSTSYNYLKLTKEALDTLEVEDGIGTMVLTNEMLDRNNVDYKDTDSLVSNVINIHGVRVGILIKEKNDNEYKLSLRSKDDTNVCEIAQKFEGGGHKRAAGCAIYGDIQSVKQQIIQAAKEQLCITGL